MTPLIFCFTCGCFLDYEKMMKKHSLREHVNKYIFMAAGRTLFPAAF
jgi:hypothetical protein